MFPSQPEILAPILAAIAIPLAADPAAVLITAVRLTQLPRRWGIRVPLAGALASLAYGSGHDE